VIRTTGYGLPLRSGRGDAAAFRRLEAPPFGRAMREKGILQRFSVEDAVA